MPSSASSRQRGTSCSGSPWKRPAAKLQTNGHGLDASACPTISEVLHRSNVHRSARGLYVVMKYVRCLSLAHHLAVDRIQGCSGDATAALRMQPTFGVKACGDDRRPPAAIDLALRVGQHRRQCGRRMHLRRRRQPAHAQAAAPVERQHPPYPLQRQQGKMPNLLQQPAEAEWYVVCCWHSIEWCLVMWDRWVAGVLKLLHAHRTFK